MKKRVILTLTVLILGVGFFVLNHEPVPLLQVEPGPVPVASMAGQDQPYGPAGKSDTGGGRRWEFEQMRLRDPATGRIPPNIHRLEQDFARRLPSRQGSALQERVLREDPGKAGRIPGWQARGPWNVGGRTRALAVDVSDPTYQTLLAGGVSGGMWRSTDDGTSWTLTTGSSQLHSVTCVAQDRRPDNQNVWYYGTGEWRGNSAGYPSSAYRGDGIFKSTDGGQTWDLLPATSGASAGGFHSDWQFVHQVATDPSNLQQEELYAATYESIHRSEDGGASFTRVLGDGDLDGANQSYVVVSDTGVVYAAFSTGGTYTGVFRSEDGINWTDITWPGLGTYVERIILALAPSDQDVLYVMANNPNQSGQVGFLKYTYLSGDGSGAGGQWEDRSAQVASLPGTNGPRVLNTQGNYNMTLAVNPLDPDIVYLGGVYLYRSLDGFATDDFESLIGGPSSMGIHVDHHALVFQPGSEGVAYSGNDGGVYRTPDINRESVGWTSLNNGYSTTQFYRIAIDEDLPGNQVLIGGMQDNGSKFTMWAEADAHWIGHVGYDGGFCFVGDAGSPTGYYLYSSQNGPMYRMTVDNTTGQWTAGTQYHPTEAGDYLWINPYLMDPVDNNMIFLGTSNGLWRQNDLSEIPDWTGGPVMTNWDHVTTQPAGQYISALAISPLPGRVLYLGCASGTATTTVYRIEGADTAPEGTVPQSRWMGFDFVSGSYVSSIAIHPQDDQKVLLAASNYNVPSIFYTEDGGTSWTVQEGNLAGAYGPSVRDVAILDYGGKEIYFAATSTGLYSTFYLNGENTVWKLEAPQAIGNVVVDDVVVRHADGTVAVGTHGRGTFSISVPLGTPAEDLPGAVPALAQNVPNPFNPQTSISFNLPADGPVRLTVYDVSGKRVRTLVDEPREAGLHQVTWQGDDDGGRQVASGVYLYRLDAGAVHEVRRMTLVR